MAVKYLDNAGTQYLVNKIKAIDGKIPSESQITTMITNALNTYKEGIVTIVESLPQTGEEGKLYLMVDPSDSDVYIVYTWEENAFKRMGSKTFTLTVDSALSSTSTNPVQNKVIKSALDGKANSSHTHGSITNDGKLATASRVVITGTDKKIGISSVTTTELGYLSGVTSAIQTQLNSKSATGHTHTAGDVAGLATVATSGSYNDLSNKPTINDSTITIQKNGSLVGTFTVNGSAKTIDIPVPTKTSDLTNDSNFVDTSNSAVASGITSAKVTDYDSHIADADVHVTTSDKTKWNNGVSQSYVLRYSSSSVTDNSTIAYSTLDNTDNIKSGDKILDSDGKIFSIVSVDTANQTVTVGSALIDLALDANVVHKSGNETVGGIKSFSDNTFIKSLNFTNEVASPSSSNSAIMPLVTTVTYTDQSSPQSARLNFRITADGIKSLFPHESNQYALGLSSRKWSEVHGVTYYYGSSDTEFSQKFVTTDTAQTITESKTFTNTIKSRKEIEFTGNRLAYILPEFSASYSGLSLCTYDASGAVRIGIWKVDDNDNTKHVLNDSLGYLNVSTGSSNSVNIVYLTPRNASKAKLGDSVNKWHEINGVEPSSLSLPSGRNTRVDISSYFTNLGSGDTNSYSVSANGYIYMQLKDIATVHCFDFESLSTTVADYIQTFSRGNDGQLYVLFPVKKDHVFKSTWYTNTTVTISGAYFIPCQGNV